jgi:hypothetical protein
MAFLLDEKDMCLTGLLCPINLLKIKKFYYELNAEASIIDCLEVLFLVRTFLSFPVIKLLKL